MWEIYDRLIEGIPTHWKAEEVVRGTEFSYVRSQGGVGIAGGLSYDYRVPLHTKNLEGQTLRDVAQCIKSWNYGEASMGLAAINAYYNHPQTAKAAGVPLSEGNRVEDRIYDPFIMSQREIKGKIVTVVGHFPFIETLFAPVCEMRIIAGEVPREGDYPVSATEFLLPESDYVFLGGGGLIDKTLPRLLKLSEKAEKVILVGPSTTLSPILFDYHIHDLSGYVVKDTQRAINLIKGIEYGKIYSTGQKVSLKNSHCRGAEHMIK